MPICFFILCLFIFIFRHSSSPSFTIYYWLFVLFSEWRYPWWVFITKTPTIHRLHIFAVALSPLSLISHRSASAPLPASVSAASLWTSALPNFLHTRRHIRQEETKSFAWGASTSQQPLSSPLLRHDAPLVRKSTALLFFCVVSGVRLSLWWAFLPKYYPLWFHIIFIFRHPIRLNTPKKRQTKGRRRR